MAAGFFYVVLHFIVRWRGSKFLHYLLPPIVVGPVIMTIGLILSPVAVNMAMGKTGDGAVVLVPFNQAIIVSLLSLATTILVSLLGKGIFKLLPILAGIIVGYIASLIMGTQR